MLDYLYTLRTWFHVERIPGETGKQQIYPKRRPTNNNTNHNIIDVIKNSDNGIDRLPRKLAAEIRNIVKKEKTFTRRKGKQTQILLVSIVLVVIKREKLFYQYKQTNHNTKNYTAKIHHLLKKYQSRC